jgi:hypothetical protein
VRRVTERGASLLLQGVLHPFHPECPGTEKRNPDTNVYILYRDIRTYGKREYLYKEARQQGVLFFRYDPDHPPVVTPADKRVAVCFSDPVLGRPVRVDADLLCLATAIEARDNAGLAQSFKVSTDADGWLMEAHQKLRPVEFATEGVFLCGMGHYPKPLEESIAQAQAAAAKALTVLSRDHIMVGGIVSHIDPERAPAAWAASMSAPITPSPIMLKRGCRSQPGPVQGVRGLCSGLSVRGPGAAGLQQPAAVCPD